MPTAQQLPLAPTLTAPARRPRIPRDASKKSRVALFAAENRAFTKEEALRLVGKDIDKTLTGMVRSGDLESPATGIYTVKGIDPYSDRVQAKIDEAGAKRTSPQVLERRRIRDEERNAKSLADDAAHAVALEQLRRHIATN